MYHLALEDTHPQAVCLHPIHCCGQMTLTSRSQEKLFQRQGTTHRRGYTQLLWRILIGHQAPQS